MDAYLGLAAFAHQLGVDPVAVVVGVAIAFIAQDQAQFLDALDVEGHQLGRGFFSVNLLK